MGTKLYKAVGPDGFQHEMEGPDNASESEILNAFAQAFPARGGGVRDAASSIYEYPSIPQIAGAYAKQAVAPFAGGLAGRNDYSGWLNPANWAEEIGRFAPQAVGGAMGAAQGAAYGASVGGPIGLVAGGAIGAGLGAAGGESVRGLAQDIASRYGYAPTRTTGQVILEPAVAGATAAGMEAGSGALLYYPQIARQAAGPFAKFATAGKITDAGLDAVAGAGRNSQEAWLSGLERDNTRGIPGGISPVAGTARDRGASFLRSSSADIEGAAKSRLQLATQEQMDELGRINAARKSVQEQTRKSLGVETSTANRGLADAEASANEAFAKAEDAARARATQAAEQFRKSIGDFVESGEQAYQDGLKKIMLRSDAREGVTLGANQPELLTEHRFNLSKDLDGVFAKVADDTGVADMTRVSYNEPMGKEFVSVRGKVAKMENATPKQAYQLQKDLYAKSREYKGTPLGYAFGEVRRELLKRLEVMPEISEMNASYAAAKGLEEEASKMMNADDLPALIARADRVGGLTQKTIDAVSERNPQARTAIESIKSAVSEREAAASARDEAVRYARDAKAQAMRQARERAQGANRSSLENYKSALGDLRAAEAESKGAYKEGHAIARARQEFEPVASRGLISAFNAPIIGKLYSGMGPADTALYRAYIGGPALQSGPYSAQKVYRVLSGPSASNDTNGLFGYYQNAR